MVIYIIVNEKGRVINVLPYSYKDYIINNYGNKLIVPGLTDLHIHSVQYPNRGLCLDLPLMEWLLECTFPMEAKFNDLTFSEKVLSQFHQ